MITEQMLGWLPARTGRIVAMCSFRDQIIVACEYGVYRMWEDPYSARTHLEKIHFAKPMPDPI
jgi:hypothetical protein